MADQADESPAVAVAGPRTPRRRAATAALAVLVALSSWLGWRDIQIRRAEDIQSQVLQAARAGMVALTSIDHDRVDEGVQRILDTSTGGFREDFAQRAEPFKDAARKAQSTSVGTVSEAGVESVDGAQGRVLVALTVMTSNRGVPEQQPKAWRTRVTVTKDDGRFKVAAVEFVR
ncbi:mammalian cell entry protein [Mycolicibacterium sp.]|uniref:mammalian cell entry protein n=1 Tax=Mycolicibacterium sp. TaxID=2320850 RepID=UPI0028AD7A0D|nr:mammalian cell entry protein [Mycolicibacterium sp.]